MSETMPAVEERVREEYTSAPGLLALWFTVFAGPISFLLHLQLGYMLVDWACRENGVLVLDLITIGAIALALIGALVGWRIWVRLGREWPKGSRGGPIARSRFMSMSGVLLGLMFALVAMAQGYPALVLNPCQ